MQPIVGESWKLRTFLKPIAVSLDFLPRKRSERKLKDCGFPLFYSPPDQRRPGGSRPRGEEAERYRERKEQEL